MICDICGEDKTGVIMVVDHDGRYVVCPDCTRLMPPSSWKRDTDEPEQRDEQTG